MSMLEHEEYLENELEKYQEFIYAEYKKHFNDNEMYIIKQIRLGELDVEVIKDQLKDFFAVNPTPYHKQHDYTICSDEDILDRLDIDLGGVI